jgi:toxin-antitoxin system PIN domain toxin
MILFDVNVLVYAHREDAPPHRRILEWLEKVVDGDSAFALSDLVLSGFLRVVTHPRVFVTPSPIEKALEFINGMRARANCALVSPGQRHWEIFTSLCGRLAPKGNLIPDAFFAALAIEWGCTWATTDGDYARFPGLSWVNPLV